MKNELLPNDYKETLELIIQRIELAQQKAVISANTVLMDLYWDIGNILLDKKKEQGWGAKVISTLSNDITSNFPGTKGYSSRNLEYMSQFAKTYSNYLDIKEELSKVSWSHNLVLMSKVKNEKERIWYINETIKNGWARSVLINQIEYGLYDRATTEEKTHNFPKTLPSVQSELAIQTLKDPYIFDFLTLSKEYKEKDLEDLFISCR